MKSLLTQIENLIAEKAEDYVESHFYNLKLDEQEDKIDNLVRRETTKMAEKLVGQFVDVDLDN